MALVLLIFALLIDALEIVVPDYNISLNVLLKDRVLSSDEILDILDDAFSFDELESRQIESLQSGYNSQQPSPTWDIELLQDSPAEGYTEGVEHLHHEEFLALRDFFNATNGQDWTITWGLTVDLTDPDMCVFGVQCLGDHVTSIILTNNNLRGALPESIGDFSQLTTLILSFNHLSGTIPLSLYGLSKLTTLDFSFNELSGTLSENIGDLVSLSFLDLHRCSFEGSIPETLYDLTHLSNVVLNRNMFASTISDHVGQLQELQILNIGTNALTGTIPESLWTCRKLIQIGLERASLTGTISNSIGNLHQLQQLDVHSNKLSGTIPSSLGNLVMLTEIRANTNYFTGSLPETLGNLQLLEALVLYHNHLDGTLPESLGGLLNLVDLQLGDRRVGHKSYSGTIPQSFENLVSAKIIVIQPARLTGEIPAFFGNLSNLRELHLNNNLLTGTIDEALISQSLNKLGISNNNLSGTIPNLVQSGDVPLVYLNVSQNFFLYGPNLPRAPGTVSDGVVPVKDTLEFSNAFNMNCRQLQSEDVSGLSIIDIDPSYYDYAGCSCLTERFWYEEPTKVGPFRGKCIDCPSNNINCDPRVHVSPVEHIVHSGFFGTSDDGSMAVFGQALLTASIVECFPVDLCVVDDDEFKCREGHFDRLCSRCKKHFFLQNFYCTKCIQYTYQLMFALDVVIVICFLIYIRFTSCGMEGHSKLQISIFYLQLLSILRVAGLYPIEDAPGAVRSITAVLGLEGLTNFNPLALECFAHYDYVVRFWVLMAFPLVAFLIAATLYVAECFVGKVSELVEALRRTEEESSGSMLSQRLYPKDSGESMMSPVPNDHYLSMSSGKAPISLRERYYYMFFYLLEFAYFPVIAVIISSQKCSAPLKGGLRFLQIAPWVECTETAYYAMMFAGITMLFLYVIGVKIYFAVSLKRSYNKHNSPRGTRHISFTWNMYQNGMWWWGVSVDPLRKIAISCYLLFEFSSIYGILIIFSTVFLTSMIQLKLEPYVKRIDNYFEVAMIFVVSLMYLIAAFESIDEHRFTPDGLVIASQVVDCIIKIGFIIFLCYHLYKHSFCKLYTQHSSHFSSDQYGHMLRESKDSKVSFDVEKTK